MRCRIAPVLLIVLIAASVNVPAFASEEEFLPWSEVRIVSPERKDVGKVVFTAKMARESYEEVTIEAFGKRYVLEKKHLEMLQGFPLASLTTSHEAGYERLGGHMVHFKLKTVAYAKEGQLLENRVILTVTPGKGITISRPPATTLIEVTP